MYTPICPLCDSHDISIKNHNRRDIFGNKPIIDCGCIRCGHSWKFIDTNLEFVPVYPDPHLKPCPFCCGAAEIRDNGEGCAVYCTSCHARGRRYYFPAQDKLSEEHIRKKFAADFWNKRIDSPW